MDNNLLLFVAEQVSNVAVEVSIVVVDIDIVVVDHKNEHFVVEDMEDNSSDLVVVVVDDAAADVVVGNETDAGVVLVDTF